MKIDVSHILLQHNYEAEDVLKALSAGKDFAELAKKFSKCSSGVQGGDLGFVESSRFENEFEEAALALKPGQMSTSPVRTRFGYHIIRRNR
jgi:peptidylprolyl isomerase/peptidyl-prolyl cis-trans isomerase C